MLLLSAAWGALEFFPQTAAPSAFDANLLFERRTSSLMRKRVRVPGSCRLCSSYLRPPLGQLSREDTTDLTCGGGCCRGGGSVAHLRPLVLVNVHGVQFAFAASRIPARSAPESFVATLAQRNPKPHAF